MTEITDAAALKRIKAYQAGTVEAFERFCLDCIKITGGDEAAGTATIQFKWWPAQRELAEAICQDKEVILLKPRQMGGTWIVIAWFLYRAMFWHGHEYRITSVGEDDLSVDPPRRGTREKQHDIDRVPRLGGTARRSSSDDLPKKLPATRPHC